MIVDDADGDAGVGAGNHDDRVLGLVVNSDERATGRTSDVDHVGVETLAVHERMQNVASRVVAEAPDERGARAGPGRCHRLIQPFAPGVFGVVVAENGFAGRGKMLDGRHQIEVGATNHHDIVSGWARRR